MLKKMAKIDFLLYIFNFLAKGVDICQKICYIVIAKYIIFGILMPFLLFNSCTTARNFV